MKNEKRKMKNEKRHERDALFTNYTQICCLTFFSFLFSFFTCLGCDNQFVLTILHNKITVNSGGDGMAFADPDYAGAGTTITLRAVPEAGYKLSEWQVVSGEVEISDAAVSPAVFKMGNKPVEILALFKTIVLSMPSVVFDELSYSYAQGGIKTVVISNIGSIDAHVTNIETDAIGSSWLVISEHDEIDTINAGGNAQFSIQPVTGLNTGTYTAIITVSFITTDDTVETISTTVSLTVIKTAGAAVDGPTSVYGLPRLGSVTVNEVASSVNPGLQTAEYAVSLIPAAEASTLTWQSSTTFSNLNSNTDYYFYARTAENANYLAGEYSVSDAIRFYLVTYNADTANGGTPPTPVTVLPNTVISLADWGSLWRTASAFGSWNTRADGTGVDYIPGRHFTVNADTIFYAKWLDAQTYELPYDHPAGGGDINTGIIISQTGDPDYYGIQYPLYAEIHAAPGYTNPKWYYGLTPLDDFTSNGGYTLTVDARNILYNVLGFHKITLEAEKNGVPFSFNLEFLVER